MSRPMRTLAPAAMLGLGLAMIAPSPARAYYHKNPIAPEVTAGCKDTGLTLRFPKFGHGCGLKLPKLGLGHKARGCEAVAPAAPRPYAPASVMPATPVPSGQVEPAMPGYRAPGDSMPAAPGVGKPPMPGPVPPAM